MSAPVRLPHVLASRLPEPAAIFWLGFRCAAQFRLNSSPGERAYSGSSTTLTTVSAVGQRICLVGGNKRFAGLLHSTLPERTSAVGWWFSVVRVHRVLRRGCWKCGAERVAGKRAHSLCPILRWHGITRTGLGIMHIAGARRPTFSTSGGRSVPAQHEHRHVQPDEGEHRMAARRQCRGSRAVGGQESFSLPTGRRPATVRPSGCASQADRAGRQGGPERHAGSCARQREPMTGGQ